MSHPPQTQIRDFRRPGQRMDQLPLKLPTDLIEGLTHRAERLGCTRAALARHLLAQGLEQLETAS